MFVAILRNITYFRVVVYSPNGVFPIYALECKHSSHILEKLRLTLNESILETPFAMGGNSWLRAFCCDSGISYGMMNLILYGAD